MTRKSCHLLDMLAKLEDPRKDKGKRHPLKSILALMVSGAIISHLLSNSQ
ncbi:MAG: transposase family protein [Candidatus Poribacteria bacterium]|nr:transposase family protein [Candidatus Poribacteria bacterium]